MASLASGNIDRLSLHGQGFYRLLHLFDHRIGKGSVVQWGGEPLSVVGSPPEELNERIPLLWILLVPSDQKIGEAGDRIGPLSGRIRHRDAEVVRDGHVYRSVGGAGDARQHVRPALVLEGSGLELVLVGVGQLHVPNRTWGLLHRPGHALIALAA